MFVLLLEVQSVWLSEDSMNEKDTVSVFSSRDSLHDEADTEL